MRKDILEKVARYYKDRQSFYDSLRAKALNKARENVEVLDIEKKLNDIKILAIKGELTDDINKEYDLLRAKYVELVKPYMPKINYECAKCKDKGVVGNKYCTCFLNRYTEELKKSCDLSMLPTFTFEDNKIDTFNLNEDDKIRYRKVYALMEKFATNYPDTDKFNIFLRGGSGCGKSCLVSAIANRLIERGIMVQYITAFDLGELMLKCHLDYKNNSLSIITNAEVLIIDDLGSEPMRNNINTTYLQSILDSRLAHRKSTIVTTNLTAEQLMRKYGERVISRLLSKSDTIAIDFANTPNLRTIK